MNSDVFNVEQYATVTFEPKSSQGTIAPSGDSTIQLTAIFTLHGTPHDLTDPIQLHFDGANLTAKTHFAVPYVK